LTLIAPVACVRSLPAVALIAFSSCRALPDI
jgi:hypothetical protein